MSYVHGKETVITVNSSTVKANTSALTRGHDSHDTSGYGDDDETSQAGIGRHSFTMGGVYDDSTSAGPRSILQPLADSGAETVVTRKPAGTATGMPLETFSGYITSYVETNPNNGMVTWTADIKVTGAIDTTNQ